MKNTSKPCQNAVLKRGLLAERAKLVRDKVIPYQWKALNNEIPDAEPSFAIQNLRIAAGEAKGEFNGMVFQDSDVAKWLEAVAYKLSVEPDEKWEKRADEIIDLIGRAQQGDGYLNSYYTIAEPENRWTNLRENHELYIAGHFIEAAVAYYEATGKRKLLDIVIKLVEHISSVFGPEPEKKKGYPGHQEIELALMRLYRITGEKSHLQLAKFFIEERGRTPHYFAAEAEARNDNVWRHWGKWDHSYSQSHLPIRKQKTPVGHAVRAMYFYAAVADLALETNDEGLYMTCKTLWENTVSKKMYITGGLGSQEFGEGFTIDYDLPNDRAYAETCASIGLVFWAHRMLQLEPNSKYGDVLERALYNGALSGMSLSGDKFFYVNPLEVVPEIVKARRDHGHVQITRQGWFGVACCPPNLARLLASIHRYVYTQNNSAIYIHLFADSEISTKINGKPIKLRQKTAYPWDEKVVLEVDAAQQLEFSLHVRKPEWIEDVAVTINGERLSIPLSESGYFIIKRVWGKNETVTINFSMPVRQVRSNLKVRENIGKIALQRGPIIYAAEEIDNGPGLHALCLSRDSKFAIKTDNVLQVPALTSTAFRLEEEREDLYTISRPSLSPVSFKAIPYFTWGNRKPGEMLVWLNKC